MLSREAPGQALAVIERPCFPLRGTDPRVTKEHIWSEEGEYGGGQYELQGVCREEEEAIYGQGVSVKLMELRQWGR